MKYNYLIVKEIIYICYKHSLLPMSVVFPAQTFDKDSCIFFSVFESKADVASSSSTRTGV